MIARRVFLGGFLGAAGMGAVLSGCKGGGRDASRLAALVPTTADTLAEILLGPRPEAQSLSAPTERPLLHRGERESVLIAADTAAFVKITDNSVRESDVAWALKEVVDATRRRIGRRGFDIRTTAFPPAAPVSTGGPRPLLALVEPATLDTGSPTERASGRGRTLLLARLTITDPDTGAIVARREFYSGYELEQLKRR